MRKLTVSQYVKLKNKTEYETVLSHLKAKNATGREINFNTLSYINVKKCFDIMSKGTSYQDMCELFCIAFGIEKEEFWNLNIVDMFYSQKFLIEKFKKLQDKESKLLNSVDEDSGLWHQAGGELLNPFSNLMPLVQLGEIYGVYPYDLQDKPYNEIFVLLVVHNRRGKVQKEFNRLKSL